MQRWNRIGLCIAAFYLVVVAGGCGPAENSEVRTPGGNAGAVTEQAATETETPKAGEEVQPADTAARAKKLRSRLADANFTVVVQHPFVVIGDEAPDAVRQRARGTVKWAVDLLKKDYFPRDPDRVIEIWLFKNKESYETHCRELFGLEPGTPFGFCSSQHDALIMNVATGGGTLVHEIVHPFMEANFPSCPAWFNEGLASLYEQSGKRNGRIVGFTNWRLAGLQKAIGDGSVGSFRHLTATTDREFYGRHSGLNYAQARYLCYYLQEKGRLRDFYRRFRKAQDQDPTGYATLKSVLGTPDREAFETRWREFVLGLSYP